MDTLADFAPRWMFSTPCKTFGSDTLLGLLWSMLWDAPLFTGPECSKWGGP